ncbi:MAG: Gfo/Idh/MocA family protein [Armatimonadota bacterium]
MSSIDVMRVGMVGLSRFGGYRRKTMRATGLFNIVSGFDILPEAFDEAMREDGVEAAPSYEAVVQRDDIEAVFISTGAKFHTEQALLAMEHGKHVFIEKPLCCSEEEVEALVNTANRTGRQVGVGHADHRFSPSDQLIRDYEQNGKVGKIAAIEVNTTHSGGLVSSPDNWRFDPDKNPGGMLFQCGVHSFHHLIGLFGPIDEVNCMLRYDVRPEVGTADVAVTLLRFRSGLLGTLNGYYVTAYNHKFRVFGTNGNLYFDTYEHLAYYQARMPQAPEPVVQVAEFPRVEPPRDLPGQGDTGLRSFYKAVREGGQPSPGLQEGIRAVEVVFACDRAAKNGCTERVREFELV